MPDGRRTSRRGTYTRMREADEMIAKLLMSAIGTVPLAGLPIWQVALIHPLSLTRLPAVHFVALHSLRRPFWVGQRWIYHPRIFHFPSARVDPAGKLRTGKRSEQYVGPARVFRERIIRPFPSSEKICRGRSADLDWSAMALSLHRLTCSTVVRLCSSN